jgi:hypothetical protein
VASIYQQDKYAACTSTEFLDQRNICKLRNNFPYTLPRLANLAMDFP